MISRYKQHIKWSAIFTITAVVVTVGLKLFLLSEYPWWLLWLIIINVTTGIAFSVDKSMAIRNAGKPDDIKGNGRLPEFTLLWLSFIGGTIGAVFVMLGRRHKTIDRSFLIQFAFIIAIQCVVIGFWVSYLIFGGNGG